VNVSEVM